jgi:hypothetical protein
VTEEMVIVKCDWAIRIANCLAAAEMV